MTAIDPSSARPFLARGATAEVLSGPQGSMQLLVDGADCGGAVSAVRSRLARDTQGATPHYHRKAAEMFFVIEGELEVLVGETITTVRSGDFLVVPPHAVHAFRTPQTRGVDLLFLMPGADRFGYFRLVDRLQRGLATPQELLRTQEEFDNHFVASPAW
ncbi:cupin domain-containing protein [Kitasatospora sp. NPDC058965]|uniref:cupin domain-containing protein n=1 Tax=Kitasatospora sp. NPDC058965 TaxID=3346682 RepID=UPI0036758C69